MEHASHSDTVAGLNDVRGMRMDALRVGVLVSAIAASALLFSMSVSSFFHVKEAVLGLLLVPLAVLSAARRADPVRGIVAFWPLIAFAVLPTILSLMPAYPQVSALMHRELVRVGVLVLFGVLSFDLMREERYRRIVVDAFLLTACMAAILALLQRLGLVTFLFPEFEDAPDPLYSVFGNSGLLGGYICMALPFAVRRAFVSEKFPLCVLAIALLSPALALSGSRAAWIGAVVGAALVIPYRAIQVRRAGMVIAAIVCSVGATFIQFQETRPGEWVRAEKQDTIRLRLWFWDGASRMTADHPIVGVGPGNFAYWSPKYQGDALAANPDHVSNEAHTQFAHNEPLQIAAETGLVGVVLCGLMLLRLVHCRGEAWGGLAAAMVFGLFHFPLHSAPHALMVVLFAAMLLAQGADGSAPRWNPRLAFNATIAAMTACLAAYTVWDVLLPSYALRQANVLYMDGEPSTAAYETAINAGRFHPEAHASYANALLSEGKLEAARAQLEIALKGQDTGDLHLALGYIALELGDRAVAERHLKATLHRWPKNQTAMEYLQR